MASKAATDFLTKEVKVSNNIPNEGTAEQLVRHLVLLANEEEINATKSRFAEPPSQHIYSISPVTLKDHGLLISVTDRVRQLDKQKGRVHAAQMGMLLSEEAPWPRQGSGNLKRAAIEPKKDTPISNTKKNEATVKVKTPDNNAPPPPAKDNARQNVLNFGAKKLVSESKPKETSETAPKEKKAPVTKPRVAKDSGEKEPTGRKANPQAVHPKEALKPPSVASSKGSTAEPPEPITGPSHKAPARSKRILDSEEDEDEPVQNRSRPAIKRKKSRATDDDDDDTDVESPEKRDTAGLQAMMDIDDDNVVNGRSTREATPEHVLSAREAAAAAKAAKIEASKGVDRKERTSRKRIPKGKKRVMKTRRVKNAKGYMVTEDYSSYEDADPNDSEKDGETDVQSETDYGDDIDVDVSGKVVSAKTSKPTAKSQIAQPKRQPDSSSSTKLKKGKSSDNSKPGQQKLASFFGKK
ncbi:unnamed protein product [Rhizoctonia solani]|uniref:DNA polymerase delta subunit 3 n=1 Tax=Rhizoctonia solani TaxID=456999 RepID=A0A8H3AD61_9AGAM|nr:unnamed protein product [Rhizoctonia solani]